MKSFTFFSRRVQQDVTICLGYHNITYVYEDPHKKVTNVISFERWAGCHIDDVHLHVDCKETFEDPRFEYWLKNNEFENIHIVEMKSDKK